MPAVQEAQSAAFFADGVGQLPVGALDAVAEADDAHVRRLPHALAEHGHGVRVVEHERVGTDLLHVVSDLLQGRQRAEEAEDAARAHRVAYALVDAVLERDVYLVRYRLAPTGQDGHNDVIGAVERLAAVCRGDDLGRVAALADHLAHDGLHVAERLGVNVHEAERGGPQGREAEGVPDHRLSKDLTAGTDDCDLSHWTSPESEAARRRGRT